MIIEEMGVVGEKAGGPFLIKYRNPSYLSSH